VKDDALRILGWQTGSLHHVPGNSLALAIRIGGEIDLRGGAGCRANVLEHRLLGWQHFIDRLETALDIHTQRFGGQIAHMPDGGLDHEIGPQIAADGARLGG